MASQTIPVPHEPEFHSLTLSSGIEAYPTGARNGYMVFPDGKVRVEINVKGLTANTMTNIANMPSGLWPTHAGIYGTSIFGNDNNANGTTKGMLLQVINTGVVRVMGTHNYAVGLCLEYYP